MGDSSSGPAELDARRDPDSASSSMPASPPSSSSSSFKELLYSAVTAAVSPRLSGRLKYATLLATIVLALTAGSVVALVFALMRSLCEQTWAAVPVNQLGTLKSPRCDAYTSTDFSPSLSLPGSPVVTGQVITIPMLSTFTPANTSAYLDMLGFYRDTPPPLGYFTQCALFSQVCTKVEVGLWLYGLVRLRDRLYNTVLDQSGTTATSAPGLPPSLGNINDIDTMWAAGGILPDALNFLLAAPDSSALLGPSFLANARLTQPTQSFTNAWLNATNHFNSSTVIRTIRAPAGEACCDLILERNTDVPAQYALTIQSSNQPAFPSDSCPSTKQRCSTLQLAVSLDFTCWAPSPPAHDASGASCAKGTQHLDFSFSFFQNIGPAQSWLLPVDPSSQAMLSLTAAAAYDTTGATSLNGTALTTWAAFGPDIPSLFSSYGPSTAAWAALLTVAYPAAVSYGSFLAGGTMTAHQMFDSTLTQGYGASDQDGPVLGWWAANYMYCDTQHCPSYLTAVADALGYATYVEILVALAAILVYMSIFPEERRGFGGILTLVTRNVALADTHAAATAGGGGKAAPGPGAGEQGRRAGCCSYAQQAPALAAEVAGLHKAMLALGITARPIPQVVSTPTPTTSDQSTKLPGQAQSTSPRPAAPPPAAAGEAPEAKIGVRSVITGIVSPRLAGRVRHAFLLALLVLGFTLGSVVALVFALRAQCLRPCAAVPSASVGSLINPTCTAFTSSTFASSLSTTNSSTSSTAIMAAFTPPPILSYLDLLGVFQSSQAPIGYFTQCAYFAEMCTKVETALWLYGLVRLRDRLYGTAPTALPPSLSNLGDLSTMWAGGSILPDALNFVLAAKPSSALGTNAFLASARQAQTPKDYVDGYTARPDAFNHSTVVRSLQAPAGEGCCDVLLERNTDSPGQYALFIQTSSPPAFPNASCPDPSRRCATFGYYVQADFSCWAPGAPATDAQGTVCAGRTHLYFTMYFNQYVGAPVPWLVPVNPISNAVLLLYSAGTYDTAGDTTVNGTPVSTWDAFGFDLPAIYAADGPDVAAWAALIAVGYPTALAYGTFLAGGLMTAAQMNQSALTSTYGTKLEDGPVISLWDQTYLYCCTRQCPTYLAAIGNALGYATILEMLMAFVFIGGYLLMFPEQRRGFGDLLSLATQQVDIPPAAAASAAGADKEGPARTPSAGDGVRQSSAKVAPEGPSADPPADKPQVLGACGCAQAAPQLLAELSALRSELRLPSDPSDEAAAISPNDKTSPSLSLSPALPAHHVVELDPPLKPHSNSNSNISDSPSLNSNSKLSRNSTTSARAEEPATADDAKAARDSAPDAAEPGPTSALGKAWLALDRWLHHVGFKSAITAAVSPRLAGRVRHDFSIAVLVLFLTMGGIIAVLFGLRSQCPRPCSSVSIEKLGSLESPTCGIYTSTTFAPSLSSPNSLGSPLLFSFAPAASSAFLTMLGLLSSSQAPSATLTRCALFGEACAKVETGLWLYGLVRLRDRLYNTVLDQSGATQTTMPGLPPSLSNLDDVGSMWRSGAILPDALDFITAAPDSSALPVATFLSNARATQPPQSAAAVTSHFNRSSVVRTIRAPAGEACCDLILERNTDVPGQYALTIQSSNSPAYPSDSCPSTRQRCSTLQLVVSLDFTCWAPSPPAQDASGASCAKGTRHLAFSIAFDQNIGAIESYLSPLSPDAQATLAMRGFAAYDTTGATLAAGSGAVSTWAAFGFDVPAIYASPAAGGPDAAAWAALFPVAYAAGAAYGTLLAGGMMTAGQMAGSAVTHDYFTATVADGPVVGWWSSTYVYCCIRTCPPYLATVGNALGYATYLEMLLALLCIGCYLSVYPGQRRGFGDLLSLASRQIVVPPPAPAPQLGHNKVHPAAPGEPVSTDEAGQKLAPGAEAVPPEAGSCEQLLEQMTAQVSALRQDLLAHNCCQPGSGGGGPDPLPPGPDVHCLVQVPAPAHPQPATLGAGPAPGLGAGSPADRVVREGAPAPVAGALEGASLPGPETTPEPSQGSSSRPGALEPSSAADPDRAQAPEAGHHALGPGTQAASLQHAGGDEAAQSEVEGVSPMGAETQSQATESRQGSGGQRAAAGALSAGLPGVEVGEEEGTGLALRPEEVQSASLLGLDAAAHDAAQDHVPQAEPQTLGGDGALNKDP